MFVFISLTASYGQVVAPAKQAVSTIGKDTTKVTTDTSKNHLRDTQGRDTVIMKDQDGLETVVTIVANDSSWNQVSKNILHLYKGAKVKYQDFELSADYIRLDRNTNELFASGVLDHNGKYIGRPVVLFPNDTPKSVDSLLYDYKKKEGNTYGIMTEVDGGFIQAKILRKKTCTTRCRSTTGCTVPVICHSHIRTLDYRFPKGW